MKKLTLCKYVIMFSLGLFIAIVLGGCVNRMRDVLLEHFVMHYSISRDIELDKELGKEDVYIIRIW